MSMSMLLRIMFGGIQMAVSSLHPRFLIQMESGDVPLTISINLLRLSLGHEPYLPFIYTDPSCILRERLYSNR